MKQPRLAVMLAVLIGLLVLRWWVPASASPSDHTLAVVPATVRAVAVASPGSSAQGKLIASASDLSAGTRDAEDGRPRNAFAVRVRPAPPKPATPSSPPAPRPFVGPPLPPPPVAEAPPPPPPLQVIGGWNDERGASVFVAGPRGVMQGRVGDMLLSEYRITQIGPQQVMVTHVPTNRTTSLTVPSGTLPALTAAR